VGTLRLYLVGVLATFSLTSVNAPAATSETNPVRTQPATASAGSTQRVLVKLRSTAAAAGSQAQSATNTIQALTTRVNLTLVESREITAGLHPMRVVPVPARRLPPPWRVSEQTPQWNTRSRISDVIRTRYRTILCM